MNLTEQFPMAAMMQITDKQMTDIHKRRASE